MLEWLFELLADEDGGWKPRFEGAAERCQFQVGPFLRGPSGGHGVPDFFAGEKGGVAGKSAARRPSRSAGEGGASSWKVKRLAVSGSSQLSLSEGGVGGRAPLFFGGVKWGGWGVNGRARGVGLGVKTTPSPARPGCWLRHPAHKRRLNPTAQAHGHLFQALSNYRCGSCGRSYERQSVEREFQFEVGPHTSLQKQLDESMENPIDPRGNVTPPNATLRYVCYVTPLLRRLATRLTRSKFSKHSRRPSHKVGRLPE